MSDYDNNNTGVLFRNERKESERHPDYNGSCEVNGVEMWISAWLKTSKTGKKFFSFAFNPKEIKAGNSQPVAAAVANDFNEEEDIPF